MQDDSWDRMKSLFDQAKGLGGADRSLFLERACCDDPRLKTELQGLLSAYDEAGEFLVESREQETLEPRPSRNPGDDWVIDRFRVLSKLGEGGFGTVYKAEQLRPVVREVALKLLRPGMDSRQIIARFEAERQAVALMDHPNIARVFDGGSTDGDRPYFVMEYVDGEPITIYCDEAGLSLEDRLRLFLDVCGAVQHAHQKGIIHRDIKPSNVLVGRDGNSANPKVIDFGVAKAIEGRMADQTQLTVNRQVIGTPAYMSPEQAGAAHTAIDTRTDVYSLGVLLYELITGVTPFDEKFLNAPAHVDLFQIIREKEPQRPSTRVSAFDDDSSICLSRDPLTRRSRFTSLGRRLRGDLDWIVMKCLEKEAERRYASASALADDIQRHLANEPVSAGPPGAMYRLGKLARRNRGVVFMASLLAMALVVGSIVSATGWMSAVQAEKDAEAVTVFLADMLRSAHPKALGREVTVKEMLDRKAGDIAEEFTDQPLIEARLQSTVGTTYASLGLYATAEQHNRRAYDLRQEHLGQSARETIDSGFHLARNLLALSRYDECEPLLRRVLEHRRATLEPEHMDTLECMVELGVFYRVTQNLGEAEKITESAVEILQRVAPSDSKTLEAQRNLASIWSMQGKVEKSTEMLDRTVRGLLETAGEENYLTLLAQFDLATLHCTRGNHQVALKTYSDVNTRCVPFLGEDHRTTLAVQSMLAKEYKHVGQPERALASLEPVLQKQRASLGDGHRDVLESTKFLAEIHDALGHKEEAVTLYMANTRAYAESRGEKHAKTLSAMVDASAYLVRVGRLDEAGPLIERAYSGYRETLGITHDETANARLHLLNLYNTQKRHDETEALITTALQELVPVVGEAHADVQELLHRRAHLYARLGKFDEAGALYRSTFTAQAEIIGNQAKIKEYRRCLANHLYSRGMFAEAYRHQVSQLEQARASGAPPAAISMQLMTMCYTLFGQEQFDKAESRAREALEIQERLEPPNEATHASALAALSMALMKQANFADAEPMLRKTLDIRRQALAPGSWQTAYAASMLGECLLELERIDEGAELIRKSHAALSKNKRTPSTRIAESAARLSRVESGSDEESGSD